MLEVYVWFGAIGGCGGRGTEGAMIVFMTKLRSVCAVS